MHSSAVAPLLSLGWSLIAPGFDLAAFRETRKPVSFQEKFTGYDY
jgi:hypothetical protein